MDGLGQRLKNRARELGLSDAEVARRLGLSQARYNHYTNDVHEPDLHTLTRIAAALGVQTDHLLGVQQMPEGREQALRARVASAISSMNLDTLRTAAALMETLATVSAEDPPADETQV
jgi:transcriptional regulator with XRE-family HTH domain